ncbi:hypothetical protein Halxa_0427 (plasmid) [Halopiger xanaduensis SH-6]|uniref:Uncharacterized protein n=1 Tax=Halopiger xanaduensis (strain DSM 18323 / JCM 14033 / SH-6) TaxID=797210 RepID=F8DDD8_HALXS|nr:hypothetical protein Halxa_0427 [Halopiger xanaduensis SH-6]
MGNEDEKRRAAAVCESCGTAHAVRLGSDGEIQPIGSELANSCTCGNGDLRILSADKTVLDDVDT